MSPAIIIPGLKIPSAKYIPGRAIDPQPLRQRQIALDGGVAGLGRHRRLVLQHPVAPRLGGILAAPDGLRLLRGIGPQDRQHEGVDRDVRHLLELLRQVLERARIDDLALQEKIARRVRVEDLPLDADLVQPAMPVSVMASMGGSLASRCLSRVRIIAAMGSVASTAVLT